MLSSGAPDQYWPLAARHSGEERLRQQLWDLGIPTPELWPFGARAMAKRKTWFQRAQPWRYPMERVQVWGPASDMSMTSNGSYVLTEGGHWLRTTIVVVPNQMARTAEELLVSPEMEEHIIPEENEVSVEIAVCAENPVSAENAELAEHEVSEANAVLDTEAVLDDGQVADFKDVLPNKETVGQASRAGAGKGPPFAEQVLDVNGEIQLRDLEPGEMQYVTEGPRYRMRQKTTPAQTSTKPSLCAMREGGESMDELGEEEEATGAWWGQMEELVSIIHQRLRNYITEELNGIQNMEVGMAKNAVELIKAAQGEMSQLENQLQSLAKVSVRTMQLDVEMIPEVLQTRTVPLDEARADLRGWTEAFQKEMENHGWTGEKDECSRI